MVQVVLGMILIFNVHMKMMNPKRDGSRVVVPNTDMVMTTMVPDGSVEILVIRVFRLFKYLGVEVEVEVEFDRNRIIYDLMQYKIV